MKKQEGEFLIKRARIRKILVMTKLIDSNRNSLYQKLLGQQVNKKYNPPLNDKEVQELDDRIQSVIDTCKEFQEELRRPD